MELNESQESEVFTAQSSQVGPPQPLMHILSVLGIQKHEGPGHGEDETEGEEEEEAEEGVSSSSSGSDDSEEEEEEGTGRGRHGQSVTRQAQLEWDDSTLPY